MYNIYSDNLIEAEWFKSLNKKFSDSKVALIKSRGNNLPIIEKIISYDRPDIILLKNNKPLLVVEKTREVPTGHNVGQRMARLVRSVELNIPTIFFFPFDSRKHGVHSGICNMNARILLAFKCMWKIHDCPIIALNWKSDDDGELIGDGSENNQLIEIIDVLEKDNFNSKSKIFNKLRVDNENEYLSRIKIRRSYSEKPSSVYAKETNIFIKKFEKRLNKKTIENLKKNKTTIIYKMIMSEDKCKRQDPYTGTQFIYDYCYCRNGIKVNDKHSNLVLFFPEIRKSIWKKKNPNNINTKSCNWYLTANLLLLKDGDIFIR